MTFSIQNLKSKIQNSIDSGVNVILDCSSISSACTDFGNLVRGNTCGIIQPCSVEELRTVVQFANDHHLQLKTRGKGYTQSGQSVAQEGFTLEVTQLNQVYELDTTAKTIACEAGAKWQDIVATTISHGMLPRVLPLNLEQTVGGLLSTGGIGSTSKTYGPVIANVVDIDIITGNSEYIKCSRTQKPELYDAVLGGLGRCGIIVSTTLELRTIKQYIRTFHLLYDSLDAWMHDQVLLGKSNQIDHLEGFCWSSAKGIRNTPSGKRFFTHWLYGLQIGVEYSIIEPCLTDILKGLNYCKLIHTEDEETASHVFRYQPRFDMMRETGAWNQTHPWIDCFMSAKTLAEIMPEILDMLPLSLGDGHRAIMVASDNLPYLFMMPPEDDIFCFAILPVGVATHDTNSLDVLEKVNQMLLNAGGKRYLSGWLGKSDFNWKQHYGNRYDTWVTVKQQYDPECIFG
ncbi:FAD-binding protein [Scytonema sp. UIC 10036]|uniref:FAD-binding protein n=1 Tax=Scytonema sp. UIC 10036 TaxID=2304196 RepID=UPI0012DAAEEA|nr:FAD-binding protein [Scytonema sp. UIC 10036]MUG92451.1 FAD-binding protein [Scytonema sp. UIC 10036]